MDNTRLINIYIKIHNKKNITLDDLRYLAQYDPECFRKTCANVVYNIPETKVVMQNAESEQTTETTMEAKELPQEEFDVLAVLDNLKQMDADEAFYKDIDALIKHGFIERISNGRSNQKKSIYRFSGDWKNYKNEKE